MLEEPNSYKKIVDYIFLLRSKKFSKSGLIKLFQIPSMDISRLKSLNEEFLIKMLPSKRKTSLDDFNNISKLHDFNPNEKEYLEIEELVKYCLQEHIKIITPFDKNIPKLLQILPQSKRDLVFIKGQITNEDLKSYSICGSRMPTQDALIKTRLIAALLAKKKFSLINGFAKGIDIEAFNGATAQKGRYIGALASGVENIYPNENKQYVPQVIKNGALISQNLLWNRVNRYALQIRNRLSAQLSLGSIFIEGNYKSGTIWQYKFAKEAMRPTFYLEPKNWDHENTHILKVVRDGGGLEIKNDLSNINEVIKVLEKEYYKRMDGLKD